MVGNKSYRRYLKVEGSGHFAIDEEQVKAEQRYDGIWVLRTNTDYNAPDGRAGDQISGARTTGVVQKILKRSGRLKARANRKKTELVSRYRWLKR